MGVTFVKATIKNPEKPTKTADVEFLVDSGAIYSVVAAKTLQNLGLKPHREQEFTLADGTKVKRKIGDLIFEVSGVRAAAPVVFGQKGDSQLLGVFTLEALGFVLDPFKRELRPAKLWLAQFCVLDKPSKSLL